MRLLLSIAWGYKGFRNLAFVMVSAMVLLTVASQLEILSLGLIPQQNVDFFEFFNEKNAQKSSAQEIVTYEQLNNRWAQLSEEGPQGAQITRHAAEAFMKEHREPSFFQKIAAWLERKLSLSKSPWYLALFVISVALFKAAALFTHRYSTRLVAIGLSAQLRQNYFAHIQMLPMRFYQQHKVASLSSRVVSDAASIAEAINAMFVIYLQTPFTLFSSFILCLLTSWKLTLIVFVGLPLIAYPITFLAKRVKRVSKQLLQNQEHFASVLLDYLCGIQTVKAFAMEEFSMRKYKLQNERMAELERKSAKYDLSTRPIIHTIAMFFLAFALLTGLFILNMSTPEVLFFCGLLYLFYEPIKKFAEENSHIQRGIAAAERLQEVLEVDCSKEETPGSLPVTGLKEKIVFDRVWFAYEDRWVLQDLSFAIKKGEMVALVGPTGSGKSTIAQLLPRLYDPQKGQITFDGLPLTQLSAASLRELIAFVPQKPFLFLDTIEANISFGRPFTDRQVRMAARRAHADEFIEQLPEGYQTLLQDAGRNLSGGQQQRLAIARALIKEAPLLILDEATSALDALSEQHIKQALKELRGQITQLVIAHRLSTVEEADKIIYLEGGLVKAVGTKERLLEECPSFKTLWLTSCGAAPAFRS